MLTTTYNQAHIAPPNPQREFPGVWTMAGSVGRVYKNRSGRWFIRLPGKVQIWCDKQHRTFYSRQHAEWTLAQIQGELERGVFDPDFYAKTRKSISSFEVYAAEWLKTCEKKVERGALSRDYFGHVRHYTKDLFIRFFGNRNMTEIKGRDIKQFYLSLDGKLPKTVYNIMGTLHKLFRDALDEEIIQQIPKFPPELKASELPEPDWKWASEEIQETIFQYMDPDDLFFVLFQCCHGTRTGETRGLQHQDIDLQNETIKICRAFSGNDLRHTKTKRIRYIPIDPLWKEIYLSRPRSINPTQFVFMRNGKPYSRTWAWRKWTEACEKAGVAHITLYQGSRHSIASQAANRGVSIYAIAKFLGHSNLKVTERYARLDTMTLRQVQRKAQITSLISKSVCKVYANEKTALQLVDIVD